MPQKLTDRQVKLAMLELLVKKGRWGAHYFPVDTIVNWFGRKIIQDGKRTRRLMKEMLKEGYLLFHKGGETVSLNPARSREIRDLISRAWE